MATVAELVVRAPSDLPSPVVDTSPQAVRGREHRLVAARWAVRLAACGVTLLAVAVFVYGNARAAAQASRPVVAALDLDRALFRIVPLMVLANAGWEHAEWRTTDVEVFDEPPVVAPSPHCGVAGGVAPAAGTGAR